MTRNEHFDATIAAIEPVGGEDTNADAARLDPQRYLLVEKNRGSAADVQSHYFTTHETLSAAWDYHQGDESEYWEVVRAVDLDTGECFVTGATTVEWHEEVHSGNHG